MTVCYIRRNLDEASILAVAVKLAFEESPHFSESELAVVAAMSRAHPRAGGEPAALGRWLSEMDADQVAGVVNNTKGVLHEMEFVRLENEDGDSVHAALFDDTNHKATDVQFIDAKTGAVWETQLKATDDVSYVADWVDEHPDGEILVTDELARRLGIESSELSNEDLTARTSDVVDKMLEASKDDSLWDYLPGIGALSMGFVIWELWERHRAGQISLGRFKELLARATAVKAGKIAALTLAMSVPGLNVLTGALLAAKLIYPIADWLGSGKTRARAPA